MPSTWRLATVTKQQGQLDSITEFLSNSDNLKAVEIIVPIGQNIKKAITTADNLVSSAVRSFEIVWDREEKKLAFWLVSSESDIENYKDSFSAVYPNVEFVEIDQTIPSWDDKTQEYHVFDASVRHGHFFSVMNYSKYPDLITHISNTIMKSQNGWIQFVFQSYDTTRKIERIGTRIDEMYKKVTDHKFVSLKEEIIYSNKKPHDHPEISGAFARNYKTLRQHSENKVINPQFIMSIRGIVNARVDLDFDFEIVQNLAFENVKTTFENITKYPYEHSKFYTDEKNAKHAKIDKKKTKYQRIDIFPLRLLPKPDKLLDSAISHYVGTNIIGKYHKRKPLPFLVLNTREMPLFVNLPDSTVKYIRLTRDQNMPKSVTNKDGFEIGEIL